jgi:hypothetical protein
MKIESKTVEFLKFLEEDNWNSTESKARELAQFRALGSRTPNEVLKI